MTAPANKLLSIVVPVFDEAGSIDAFCDAIEQVIDTLPVGADTALTTEVIFVNDGSKDETRVGILNQKRRFKIGLINFSRNFGKEAAITAGLRGATGDAVVVIDVDLQDPPSLIVELVARWFDGEKLVLARRTDRSEDSFVKRITAGLFYKLHNRISDIQIPNNVGDFRLMDRVIVDAINSLDENRRFMKGLFAWVGFEPVYVDYKRTSRGSGESKFSGWKLWRLAVEGITGFSDLPLVIWTYVGAFISSISFLYAGYTVLRTLIWGIDVPGYASLLVGILFMGGIQIVGIGVLGEYLSRVYVEVKRRPTYIVESRQDLPFEDKVQQPDA
ncbi:MAG: glycosyltransferase family 2 protein [Paracoccaceae bacterium]